MKYAQAILIVGIFIHSHAWSMIDEPMDDEENMNELRTFLNNNTYKDYGLPLIEAAAHGDTDTIKLLLRCGANIEDKTQYIDKALLNAVRNNHKEVAYLLLHAGANAQFVSEHKNTILHIAADKGYIDIVKLLLDSGADIDVTNYCNETPLHQAIRGGHKNTITELIKRGVRFETRLQDKNFA